MANIEDIVIYHYFYDNDELVIEIRSQVDGSIRAYHLESDDWERRQQILLSAGRALNAGPINGLFNRYQGGHQAIIPQKGTHKRAGLIIVVGVCLVFWGIVAALLI